MEFPKKVWKAIKGFFGSLALSFYLIGYSVGGIAALLIVTIGGGLAAFYLAASRNGVQRAALIELGSAIFLFIGLSLFISRRLSALRVILVSLLSIGAVVAAFRTTDDYWQSIFLEIGAGAGLFIALDLFLHRLFTKAIKHTKDVNQSLAGLTFEHIADDYYRMLAKERGWDNQNPTTHESP
jgi:hypothetical protein